MSKATFIPASSEVIAEFAVALYGCGCIVCKQGLEWEANFNADGTNYYARCCGKRYVMVPHTVKVTVEEE